MCSKNADSSRVKKRHYKNPSSLALSFPFFGQKKGFEPPKLRNLFFFFELYDGFMINTTEIGRYEIGLSLRTRVPLSIG